MQCLKLGKDFRVTVSIYTLIKDSLQIRAKKAEVLTAYRYINNYYY